MKIAQIVIGLLIPALAATFAVYDQARAAEEDNSAKAEAISSVDLT